MLAYRPQGFWWEPWFGCFLLRALGTPCADIEREIVAESKRSVVATLAVWRCSGLGVEAGTDVVESFRVAGLGHRELV